MTFNEAGGVLQRWADFAGPYLHSCMKIPIMSEGVLCGTENGMVWIRNHWYRYDPANLKPPLQHRTEFHFPAKLTLFATGHNSFFRSYMLSAMPDHSWDPGLNQLSPSARGWAMAMSLMVKNQAAGEQVAAPFDSLTVGKP